MSRDFIEYINLSDDCCGTVAAALEMPEGTTMAELEEQCEVKIGCSLEAACDMVERLLPLTFPILSPLSGRYMHTFGAMESTNWRTYIGEAVKPRKEG